MLPHVLLGFVLLALNPIVDATQEFDGWSHLLTNAQAVFSSVIPFGHCSRLRLIKVPYIRVRYLEQSFVPSDKWIQIDSLYSHQSTHVGSW